MHDEALRRIIFSRHFMGLCPRDPAISATFTLRKDSNTLKHFESSLCFQDSKLTGGWTEAQARSRKTMPLACNLHFFLAVPLDCPDRATILPSLFEL